MGKNRNSWVRTSSLLDCGAEIAGSALARSRKPIARSRRLRQWNCSGRVSSTLASAEGAGYRVTGMRWDPVLRQSWARVASCGHPEWPEVSLRVEALKAVSGRLIDRDWSRDLAVCSGGSCGRRRSAVAEGRSAANRSDRRGGRERRRGKEDPGALVAAEYGRSIEGRTIYRHRSRAVGCGDAAMNDFGWAGLSA